MLTQQLNNILKKLTLNKKQQYAIYSTIVSFVAFYIVYKSLYFNFIYLLLLAAVVTGSVLISNWGNLSRYNVFFAVFLPFILFSGYILTFTFFPNLSLILKIIFSVGYAGVFYLLSLMLNIFLVVDKKKELIPLYRVAVTWSEVLTALVTVPVLAGVFKLNTSFFIQSSIACILAIFFSMFIFWIRHFDPEIKSLRVGEIIILSTFVGFIVTSFSVGISFFPTEAFLRALAVSTVLMFGVGFITEYLKNSLNRVFLLRNLVIVLIFLVLLILFRP